MPRSLFPLTPRFPGRYPTGRTPAPKTPVQQTPIDKEQETPFLTGGGFTLQNKHPKPKPPTLIEIGTETASGSASSSATIKPDTQIQDSQTLKEVLQGSAAASIKDEDNISDTPKKGGRPPRGDPDPDHDPRGGRGPGRRAPLRPRTP